MPTPTPLPVTSPEELGLTFPDTSVWDMAPHSVQTWNSFSEITIVFQGILIVGLAILIFMAVMKIANEITTDE